jgi:hypothetical protein
MKRNIDTLIGTVVLGFLWLATVTVIFGGIGLAFAVAVKAAMWVLL